MVRLSGGLLALFVSLSLSRFKDLKPRSDSCETRCSVRMRVMSLHVFLTSEIMCVTQTLLSNELQFLSVHSSLINVYTEPIRVHSGID